MFNDLKDWFLVFHWPVLTKFTVHCLNKFDCTALKIVSTVYFCDQKNKTHYIQC